MTRRLRQKPCSFHLRLLNSMTLAKVTNVQKPAASHFCGKPNLMDTDPKVRASKMSKTTPSKLTLLFLIFLRVPRRSMSNSVSYATPKAKTF